ncbi:MAG: hypothetical protein ACRDRV_15985 [Pseudonocardiaceae bacterium]
MAATDALAKNNLSGARHGSRPHVLRRVGGIAFGILVVGVVLLAGAVTLVPAITGATPLTVLSGSMAPALPAGSAQSADRGQRAGPGYQHRADERTRWRPALAAQPARGGFRRRTRTACRLAGPGSGDAP